MAGRSAGQALGPELPAGNDTILGCGPIGSAEDLKDPILRRVFEQWQASAAKGGLPGTDFANPFALRFALGSIAIYDVLSEPLRFRYRLVGTDIIGRAGIDLTGKEQLQHRDQVFARAAQAGLERCVCERVPMLLTGARVIHGVTGGYESIALPLVDGIDRVARILAVQRFAPGMPWLR